MHRRAGFFIKIKGLILGFSVLLIMSCASIQKKALGSAADMLSSPGGAGVFMQDDDPRLVADALPLALKLHEMLLDMDSENDQLALATGQNFILYAGAFVQLPASMLSEDEWEEALYASRRAKKLFRRGRDYVFSSLEMRHPELPELLEEGLYDQALELITEEDADAAFWAALGWLGMASTDALDMEIVTELDKAVLLLLRALELNETSPEIHNTMIQVYLSLPPSVLTTLEGQSVHIRDFLERYYRDNGVDGNPRNRAFFHYYRAISLSEGTDPSPYITMATTLSVKEQDTKSFRSYLEKVLALDAEDHPEKKLLIVMYQEKARWLLDNVERFFLVD